jgi:hypothetical protein
MIKMAEEFSCREWLFKPVLVWGKSFWTLSLSSGKDFSPIPELDGGNET